METIVGQGGNPGRHLIVICPDFWNAINEKEPYWFYSLTKLPKDDICDMKPIELGSQFAGMSRKFLGSTMGSGYLQRTCSQTVLPRVISYITDFQ